MGGRNYVDDEQLVSLLSLTLDEAFRLDVNRRLSSKELVCFVLVPIVSKIWLRHNHQTWESVALKCDGSLTLAVFQEFWEKFLLLRATVSGVTKEEAYQVLMGAVPPKH